nr:PREDICTED: lamin tail domain-containing protein 1 [Opisthocomus hoazin]
MQTAPMPVGGRLAIKETAVLLFGCSVNDLLQASLGMFVHTIRGRHVDSSGPLLFHTLERELATSLKSFPPVPVCVSVNNDAAQPKDSLEMPNWNSAPSRNLSISKMVSGQCQNHFSPLFTYSRKVAQSFGCMESHGRTRSACKDYRKFASSAIGNLKIAEVDPGGRFVKIMNCAPEKEESVGDYLLKQDIQSQPVAVFRFPPETRMGPNSTVTVWAADATVLHKSPSDFLWKELERFRTSLTCATILYEPSGQAVAWYTFLYWNRRQGWVAKEESEEFENIVIPTFPTPKQKEVWENEQEFAITDTEWKRADPRQTIKKGQSYIKRYLTFIVCTL